jgi:hypothetical protein
MHITASPTSFVLPTDAATAIGGFFGWEPLPKPAAELTNEKSVLQSWGFDATRHPAYRNGRSALYYWLKSQQATRLWLPAYCCTTLTEAAKFLSLEIHYYPLMADFSPDGDWLNSYLQAGDHVLAINFFGQLPSDPFLNLVKTRYDVYWIEDCAQTLAAPQHWGDAILYTPRKLLGVADGGLLISEELLPFPNTQHAAEEESIITAAAALRATEPSHPALYATYLKAEAYHQISDATITARSIEILATLPLASYAEKRKQNAALLHHYLHEYAALTFSAETTPFGYPVRVKDAGSLSRLLAAEKLFIPRHWAELPSPESHFPREHEWSRTLLTLPCDHRYGEREMERLATLFLRANS